MGAVCRVSIISSRLGTVHCSPPRDQNVTFRSPGLALGAGSGSFAMRTDSSEGVHNISVRDTWNLLLELFPAQEYDIIQGQNSFQFAVIVQHWKPANTRLLKYLERFVEPRVWRARMEFAGS